MLDRVDRMLTRDDADWSSSLPLFLARLRVALATDAVEDATESSPSFFPRLRVDFRVCGGAASSESSFFSAHFLVLAARFFAAIDMAPSSRSAFSDASVGSALASEASTLESSSNFFLRCLARVLRRGGDAGGSMFWAVEIEPCFSETKSFFGLGARPPLPPAGVSGIGERPLLGSTEDDAIERVARRRRDGVLAILVVSPSA